MSQPMPRRARASRAAKAAALAGVQPMAADAVTLYVAPEPLRAVTWPPRMAEYGPALRDEPVTEDWLAANGWAETDAGQQPQFWRLAVNPTEEIGGLSVGVQPAVSSQLAGRWNCWLEDEALGRRIFVRRVRWTWELVRLCEGLTGRTWGGAD